MSRIQNSNPIYRPLSGEYSDVAIRFTKLRSARPLCVALTLSGQPSTLLYGTGTAATMALVSGANLRCYVYPLPYGCCGSLLSRSPMQWGFAVLGRE